MSEIKDAEQLAGRELDAAVAERVMGYTWHVINSRRKNLHSPTTGRVVAYVEGKETHYTGYGKPELPEFHSSIEAAMEVVEKLRERGWTFYVEADAAATDWFVSFAPTEGPDAVGEAATLPEAICLAALKAVG